MSIAANLPPRAKRLSLRIADIGVPIPPRISTFLDAEVAAFDGALASGIQDLDTDNKLRLSWASGRLHDLLDLAVEAGHADARHLPIATIGTAHMFVVDTSDPALAVYVWEADSGFKKWADDFEAFTRKLRKRGQPDPIERLDSANDKAREAESPAAVIAILTPVVADFPTSLGENDDGRDELGAAYHLLGDAWVHSNVAKAIECYELGAALGDEDAGLNLCKLLLERTTDYEKLVAVAEKQYRDIWPNTKHAAWARIRIYLGCGYLLTGRGRLAMRMYHQLSTLAVDGPLKIRLAVDALRELRDNPKADRETTDTILGWFDVPPPQLPPATAAALRAWWPALPAAVREVIENELELEGGAQLTDTDLLRISRLTELAVTESGLADISWVTRLEYLDDLDLTENDIADLAPIASLPRLTRLDVSNNKVTSLRPLATCVRLQRLVVDQNPLAGLEGIEQLHELEELHACEADLESVAPLRGLRGLTEVNIYENRIADLSPLAECPRLKEISCFTNPIKTGLAALGTLPWLESVDAGEDSTANDVRGLRYANAFVSIDQWEPDDPKDGVDPVYEQDPTARAWWNALSKPWKKAFVEASLHTGKKEPDDDELGALLREDSITIEKIAVENLEPLRKLTRLDYLCLENLGITDLSPLSRLPRLRDLIVRDNKRIDLVSLAPAEVLEELYLERCELTSLIGLERCRALREIHAEDNHIDDLRPLAELFELRLLDLEGNQVSNVAPLANLTKLRELKLGLTRVSDLAPLATCTGLRTLEVWGTPTLRNAVALAELPELTTVISHGSITPNDLAELRKRNPRLRID